MRDEFLGERQMTPENGLIVEISGDGTGLVNGQYFDKCGIPPFLAIIFSVVLSACFQVNAHARSRLGNRWTTQRQSGPPVKTLAQKES
ncbi:hypothetical protein, partial [Bifidobacterium longum]|uniref:hypothetical protein n=1 Tax=Bifidobacterium longum TaxID=216816 RepID=UPI00321A22EC